jgi:ribose transport system substrate-binding protein
MAKRGSAAVAALITTLTVAFTASACSSSSNASSPGGSASSSTGKTVSINVGAAKPIELSGSPRIAYFVAGSTNAYEVAIMKAARAAAAKVPGATITFFDPNFSAATQLNQIQDAIATKKYNAFIVQPNDGQLLCTVLTKTAPADNIAVIALDSPLCGQASAPTWASQYTPGLLQFVGIYTSDLETQYLEWMAAQNPGPQKVIALTGPALFPNTPMAESALKNVQAKYPNFKLVAQAATDFSTLEGQQKTLPLLTANPGVTIVYSVYSDITQGVAAAIKQAGLSGKVKVYDIGLSSWDVGALKDGQLAGSLSTDYPIYDANETLNALQEAFSGKAPPHVVANDGYPYTQYLANGDTKPIIITPSTVSSFDAQS